MGSKKIMITAGGTGGHILPAQAFAQDLLSSGLYDITFCAHGLSHNKFFKKHLFTYVDILSAPLSKKLFKCLKSFYFIAKGIWQSWFLLRKNPPDLVVGFGSYHTFSFLIACILKKIPFVLYEANTFPGKVNRYLAPFAKAIYGSFQDLQNHLNRPVTWVKAPLSLDLNLTKEEAWSYFQLDNDLFTILVFGGSQGSGSINEVFLKSLPEIKKMLPFQVIHLVGYKHDVSSFSLEYKKLGIKACVKNFEECMSLAWTAADLVISRSGATTIWEQIYFSVPSVLVPYPHSSDNHQKLNAIFMEKKVKGGLMIEEKRFSSESLLIILRKIFAHQHQDLKRMQTSLSLFAEGSEWSALVDKVKRYL
ncbi:MAG: UDP-N-acetylglucosamine--N-acetylmuramyl-(pentapeptide) pyrophosphoryl-undecaprenol N-acetylglucosamine transferase [Rhabdochlamydiaceae bacterium]